VKSWSTGLSWRSGEVDWNRVRIGRLKKKRGGQKGKKKVKGKRQMPALPAGYDALAVAVLEQAAKDRVSVPTFKLSDEELTALAVDELRARGLEPGDPWHVTRSPPYDTVWFRGNGDGECHHCNFDVETGRVLFGSWGDPEVEEG
jgi:hypothetical protein